VTWAGCARRTSSMRPGYESRAAENGLPSMLYSTPAAASAMRSTSSVRICRWSGRGCTVMPWHPASIATRAACAGSGWSPPRALRSTATLLTLTLSRVIRASAARLGRLVPDHRIPVRTVLPVPALILVEPRRDRIRRIRSDIDGQLLVGLARVTQAVVEGEIAVVDALGYLQGMRTDRNPIHVLVGGARNPAVDTDDGGGVQVLLAWRIVEDADATALAARSGRFRRLGDARRGSEEHEQAGASKPGPARS